MTGPNPSPPPSSIQALVADALREASELASKEIA
ncbi:MAG: phage holin family protein, partial [Methylobacteriaceae bacterium]